MTYVICRYTHKCTKYKIWCTTCKRNTGKRSYYEPDDPPGTPWVPYPYPNPYPYYEPIWIAAGADNVTQCERST